MSGSTLVFPPELGDVDVWWIDLDALEDEVPSVLSHDERLRAERLRCPRDRARWTCARVALRRILTGYTRMMPAELQLTLGTHGKPALVGEPSLRFNLAYAGGRAALAVARNRDVGIDLEPIDPGLDVWPLLAVSCSQEEAARITALAPIARPEAFLTYWTIKEAYLKGIGVGLSRDPRTVEIALLPDGRAIITDVLTAADDPQWGVCLLDAGSGWVAAVAASGQLPSIAVYHWSPAPGDRQGG